MNTTKIFILMATYNGEPYISAQIKSIQKQTVKYWQLIIRDDGSSDTSMEIIEQLAKNDSRIKIIQHQKFSIGVVKNFNELIQYALQSNADLVFFADQDDVWFPEKLSLFLKKYDEIVSLHGHETPALIHSDLHVVDSELNTIHPSFMKYIGVKPVNDSQLNRLLAQNYVTGCSMACNKALLTTAFPLPESVVMHDWWLALCAAATGELGTIYKQTVYYRQHSNNQYGAVSLRNMCNPFNTFFQEVIWHEGKNNLLGTFKMAAELNKRIHHTKNVQIKDKVNLLNKYSSFSKQGLLSRLILIFSNRIRPGNPFATLFFYFKIIFFLPFFKTTKSNMNDPP